MKIKVTEDKSNNGFIKVRRELTIEELTARMFGFERYWGNHEN